MDLALALGMTVGDLLERTSDRELDGWVAYAKKRGLPQRRQELYLAQVAKVQGGGKIDAYLLRPAGNDDAEQADADKLERFLKARGTPVIRGDKG